MRRKLLTMEFSKTEEAVFEKFFELKEEEKFQDCLAILKTLQRKHKDNSVVNGLFGEIYWWLKDFKRCITHVKRTLKKKPKSELASLLLYLSYMELGEHRKALSEVKRYLNIAEPRLHIITVKELYRNMTAYESEADRKLINDMYLKLRGRRASPSLKIIYPKPNGFPNK